MKMTGRFSIYGNVNISWNFRIWLDDEVSDTNFCWTFSNTFSYKTVYNESNKNGFFFKVTETNTIV